MIKALRGLAAFAVAGVVMGGLATGAGAADQLKSTQSTWEGFYAGGNLGWLRQSYDWAFNPPIPAAIHQAYSLDRDNAVLGIQAGYQRQYDTLVVGIEAALNFVLGGGYARETMFGNNALLDSQARISGPIFTIGPRIGWAGNDWLFFATGGYATANVETNAITIATGALAFQTKERHNGWYLGLGAQKMVTGNMSAGVEYQHIDLGTELHCPGGVCLGAGGGFVDRNIDPAIDVVRVRVDWFFNQAQ